MLHILRRPSHLLLSVHNNQPYLRPRRARYLD